MGTGQLSPAQANSRLVLSAAIDSRHRPRHSLPAPNRRPPQQPHPCLAPATPALSITDFAQLPPTTPGTRPQLHIHQNIYHHRRSVLLARDTYVQTPIGLRVPHHWTGHIQQNVRGEYSSLVARRRAMAGQRTARGQGEVQQRGWRSMAMARC